MLFRLSASAVGFAFRGSLLACVLASCSKDIPLPTGIGAVGGSFSVVSEGQLAARFTSQCDSVLARCTFYGGTSTAIGGVRMYSWDLGDGVSYSSATHPNVTHTFNSRRQFTVSLGVQDSAGNTTTTSAAIWPASVPLSSAFSVLSCDVAVPSNCMLDARASTAAGGVRLYKWDLGDGTTFSSSTYPYIRHTWKRGSYSVSLTVADSSGAEKALVMAMWFGDSTARPPKAGITALCDSVLNRCTFYGGSSTADGGVKLYRWSLGDGVSFSSATYPNVTHTYKTGGQVAVGLEIQDSIGRRDTVSKVVWVGAPSAQPLRGVLASADFEDGTIGGFGNEGATVINDPTGAFGGKAAEFRFGGSYSVNLALIALTPTVSDVISFSGDLYIPRPANVDVMRKLIYWHNNPYAYWSTEGTYVTNRVSATVGLFGNSIYWGGGHIVQGSYGGLGTIPFDTKVNLKVEHYLGTVGNADGVVKIWVDGVLIWTSPGINFRQEPADGFGYFQVGEQAQSYNGSVVDEVRYWDNVSISNSFISR